MDAAFRLDSGAGFGRLGQYSFAGRRPFGILKAFGDQIAFETAERIERWTGDPFEAIRTILNRYAAPYEPRDRPLQHGGMVGYLSYNLRRWIERVPHRVPDDLALPDLWLACFREIRGQRHDATYTALQAPEPPATRHLDLQDGRLVSSFTGPAYLHAVRRIKEYIVAGDVYQVNLAQRFALPWTGAPEHLYRRLIALNPAPFAAYLDGGDFQIASISPELFLRFDPISRMVETRPIKGTRPRGKTASEDAHQSEALLASEKDGAEHIMIVDLERNDLGRVCETGSVSVSDLCRLEAHPTVWHLVSGVTGRLRPEFDRIDLLRAAFPGGSITGAPKIRAMEIIDELEPTARGVYTGAIGYLGFDGTMDLNITIRTIVITSGMACLHAGGGIVADSDPAAEYDETIDKARALLYTLGAVE